MFAVLIGSLLIAKAVLCQNPDICDSQHADARQQMCTAVANAVNGAGDAYDCQDCQTTDGKPLKVFTCAVSAECQGTTAMALTFLNAAKVEGGKVSSINVYECDPKDGGELSCTADSPVDCDISL